MGPLSYVRTVVDRNIIMRRIPVYAHVGLVNKHIFSLQGMNNVKM